MMWWVGTQLKLYNDGLEHVPHPTYYRNVTHLIFIQRMVQYVLLKIKVFRFRSWYLQLNLGICAFNKCELLKGS